MSATIGAKRSSRTFLSSVSSATLILSAANSLIASNNSGFTFLDSNTIFSFPISFWTSRINATIFLIASCPAAIASNILSSETSLAPASIMTIFSSVPATVKVRSLLLRCSRFGLITISSSTKPTLTPPIGPFHGISEIESATEVAINPVISGWLSISVERTVITTETSFLISFGNNGRIGRSTIREVKIERSEGLPSLFKKDPGILPTAYSRSS